MLNNDKSRNALVVVVVVLATCVANAKAQPHLPSTRVRCHEGLAARETRACVYHDIYWSRHLNGFVAYHPHAKPPPDNAVVKSRCETRLRTNAGYMVRRVATLPKNESLSLVQVVTTPTYVEDKFHGCFGHRLLEEYFALYWLAAEAQATWLVDRRKVAVLVDGPVLKAHKPQFRRWLLSFNATSSDAFSALTSQSVLHVDELRKKPLWRFKELRLGGALGRTPYTSTTFGKRHVKESNLESARSANPADTEYAKSEKSAAAMHFMRHVADHFSEDYKDLISLKGGRRLAHGGPDIIRVAFLNRERFLAGKRLHPSGKRRVANAGAILAALTRAFTRDAGVFIEPQERVPPQMSLSDMIRWTRHNVTVLISPHGSQLSNAGFLRPGGAIIELHPPGCVIHAYDAMASHWCLLYERVTRDGRGCDFDAPIVADVRAVVAAVKRVVHRLRAGDARKLRATAAARLRHPPRREPSSPSSVPSSSSSSSTTRGRSSKGKEDDRRRDVVKGNKGLDLSSSSDSSRKSDEETTQDTPPYAEWEPAKCALRDLPTIVSKRPSKAAS